MEIEFFDPSKYSIKLKATIHASGKLGFSRNTAVAMGMTETGGVKIGRDQSGSFYLEYCKVFGWMCFRVQKAGEYYYVNAKPLFDELGLDYKNKTIIFDMVKIGEYYKLLKRETRRKKNEIDFSLEDDE